MRQEEYTCYRWIKTGAHGRELGERCGKYLRDYRKIWHIHWVSKFLPRIFQVQRKSDSYLFVYFFSFFFSEWSEVAPIGIGRILPGVALLDGKVYVVGGELESSIISSGECYDPRDNVWSPIACMIERRCEFGLCALDNNLYAFGGWVGEDIGGSIEIYDPLSNNWTPHGELPEPRFSMGVVAYEGTLNIIQPCCLSRRITAHKNHIMNSTHSK